jgi:hypothetical protein
LEDGSGKTGRSGREKKVRSGEEGNCIMSAGVERNAAGECVIRSWFGDRLIWTGRSGVVSGSSNSLFFAIASGDGSGRKYRCDGTLKIALYPAIVK